MCIRKTRFVGIMIVLSSKRTTSVRIGEVDISIECGSADEIERSPEAPSQVEKVMMPKIMSLRQD